MISSTEQVNRKRPFFINKTRTHNSNKKPSTRSFQEFYQSRSKSFSLTQSIKNMRQTKTEFIDQELIDVIDQRTPIKRISEFIKRKVSPWTKIKTEQIQFLTDHDLNQNNRHVKIFSSVFNRERSKVLGKFENNKQMRQTVLQKLGMMKPKVQPFFQMKRKNIFSIQDRYIDVFKELNSRKKFKKSMKRVHPICDIYDQQAQNVLLSRTRQRTKTINYQPFGKIDYSLRYF